MLSKQHYDLTEMESTTHSPIMNENLDTAHDPEEEPENFEGIVDTQPTEGDDQAETVTTPLTQETERTANLTNTPMETYPEPELTNPQNIDHPEINTKPMTETTLKSSPAPVYKPITVCESLFKNLITDKDLEKNKEKINVAISFLKQAMENLKDVGQLEEEKEKLQQIIESLQERSLKKGKNTFIFRDILEEINKTKNSQ